MRGLKLPEAYTKLFLRLREIPLQAWEEFPAKEVEEIITILHSSLIEELCKDEFPSNYHRQENNHGTGQ